jgi:hypothetical protein
MTAQREAMEALRAAAQSQRSIADALELLAAVVGGLGAGATLLLLGAAR